MPKLDLYDVTFTDQDDIVPLSGKAIITNDLPFIVNTLAGNDIINADNEINDDFYYPGAYPNRVAFYNQATLNTAEGNDEITGVVSQNTDFPWEHHGILNEPGNYLREGRIDTGDGNDILFGIVQPGIYGNGISNKGGTIDTGDGDDKIIAISYTAGALVIEQGTISTGDGQDKVSGVSPTYGIFLHSGSVLDTGKDNDIITGSIYSAGIINTGSGEDFILLQREFINSGNVFLGEGNDSLIADAGFPTFSFYNYNAIDTGDGHDTITSTGIIYNQGIITTGNGDDSIIVDGSVDGITGSGYGIYNNGGAINMGDGNDSIIANGGFESAPNSSGAWFLGEGEDYIKGYGSGDFYGGNGFDRLELTPGTYTVGIWDRVVLAKGNSLMLASEFEQLIAGDTIYDFASLTAGQIIVVA